MKSWLLKSFFILQLVVLAASASSENVSPEKNEKYLQLGCSDWKPYCYKQNSNVRGQLIDLTRTILDAAGFEYTIDVFPWKRVYQQGLKQTNFLILGLGRTAKREKLFKWIAPLKNPSEIYAYQYIESDIVLTSNDDLSQYSIAVERGSYTYDFLVKRGHDKEKIIIVSRYDQLYRMVRSKRAQLLLMDSKAFRPEAMRNGFNPELFKPSLLTFVVTEYLATGLNTSDDIVERLKASYDTLLQQGKIVLPD
jgi:polar amino acid transport system substrate-binding protein